MKKTVLTSRRKRAILQNRYRQSDDKSKYVGDDVQREGGWCEPFMMETEPVFECEVNVVLA